MDPEQNGAADPALEQEALSMGWSPKEKFRGSPDKWVDAAEFVRRGKEVLPILRHTNGKLVEEVGGLKATVGTLQTQLKESAESLKALVEYNAEVEKRAYERALANLKAEKRAALKDGDHDRAAELDEQLDELREAPPKPIKAPAPAPAAPEVNPIYAAWARENAGLLDTQEKQAYAASIGQYIRVRSPSLVDQAFLDEVAKELKSRFDPAPPTPRSKVEGGTNGGSGGRGKSYDDLPPDAKQACDSFASRMVGPNRAYKSATEWRKRYVEQYFGE